MVLVAKAVVDKYTMVVKLLDAPITVVAMLCVFWHQGFTRYAHIVQVIVFSYELFQQSQKVWLLLHIPRIFYNCLNVK